MTDFIKPALRIALIFGLTSCASSLFAQTDQATLAEVSAFFADAKVIGEPKIVDCTLSGGTKTTCFSITVKAEPQNFTPGPWCPSNVSDTAEAGGIWMRDGKVYDVDGAFIKNLAAFYGDAKWQLFDPETGKINFTGTIEACQAAARPDVDPAYQNYCVQCLPEYMPEDATMTYVIPLEPQPVWRGAFTGQTGSGLAYNGLRLDGPAPLDAILSAHTIAPFDDCGGHVNTHVGYHYHAVTDCLENAPATFGPLAGAVATEHGKQVGIAMDGYQIFSRLMGSGDLPDDLDRCNGHKGEDVAYHYHAGAAGSNAILGCLSAEAGCASDDASTICDASAPPPRP